MIISKDLFIFGEQIFATIIPEGASAQSQLQQIQQQQQQPAIINNTTAASSDTTTTTRTTIPISSVVIRQTGEGREATVEAAAAAAAEQVVDFLNKTTSTSTLNKHHHQQQQETVPSGCASPSLVVNINNVKTNNKFTKVQKIPTQGEEELKIPKRKQQQQQQQQQQEHEKCETTTQYKRQEEAQAEAKKDIVYTSKVNPMNFVSEESASVHGSETETEQEPLVKQSNNINITKIIPVKDTTTTTTTTPVSVGVALTSTASGKVQTSNPNSEKLLYSTDKQQQQQQQQQQKLRTTTDCRLQLELPVDAIQPNLAESVVATSAAVAAVTTNVPVLVDQNQLSGTTNINYTATSSSSSASSPSSSPSTTTTKSSSLSSTSQTTIPSSDLNLSTINMEKSILTNVKGSNGTTEHATVTFPFVVEQHPTLQLTFQSINVLHNERQILTDVSGFVSPGEVLAIMGPSGSGKTTLLDCLSGQRHIDSGGIFLNRESLSKKWRRRIGYVLQEEIFFPQLTLRETVMYTALLRLPETITKAEKSCLVDRILEMLELNLCQQTKIGDYLNRGLSGGEKKRANIACELLTNPLLMLLDEPTSGLDSHSAISLMKVLKRYAFQEQKTIVITVHQPSSQMFHMFDKLLLLYNGRTAYFGEVSKIYKHFEDIGVTIKPHYNPADFVLEQLKSYPDIREKLFNAAKESHIASYTDNGHHHHRHHHHNHHQEHHNETNVDQTIDINVVPDKTKAQNNMLINDMINNYYNEMHCNAHNHNHNHNLLHHNNKRLSKHADAIMMNPCDEEAAQHLVWCGGDSQSNFSSSNSSDCHSYHGIGNGNDSGEVDSGENPTTNSEWLDYPTRFHTQFQVLLSRNFKEAKPRMLSKLNWFQTIGLALMAGAIWFQIPRTEEFLHDLQGWMFFSQTYWMLFAHFGALNSFPSEREVISKERRAGAYRLSAYYLAKMFSELPLIITLPTVYLIISYPMLGCSSLKLFFLMLIFLLLNTIVAQSVGFFIGACCMDMNVGITLSALYTLATQLFGGYLSSRIPEALSWIRYTSMIHYAYQNMQILEFSEGPAIRCGISSSYEICKDNTTIFIPYEEILKAQNSNNPLWLNTCVLIIFFLVFRGFGYAVLRYLRCPRT